MMTAGRFAVRRTAAGAGEVRIGSVRGSDAGLYVCEIVNEHGAKQAECRVEVKGERQRRRRRRIGPGCRGKCLDVFACVL